MFYFKKLYISIIQITIKIIKDRKNTKKKYKEKIQRIEINRNK